MKMHSLDFHNLLQKRGTFFCYSGLLSEDVISTFTDIIREQMNDIEDNLDAIQRAYKIIGENMIPSQYLEYVPGAKVKGVAIDQHIAPIIIEYKQKK